MYLDVMCNSEMIKKNRSLAVYRIGIKLHYIVIFFIMIRLFTDYVHNI